MTIKSPENFHNKLAFVFHAMLALPLAAFVYLFLEIKHSSLEPVINDDGLVSILDYVLPFISLGIVTVGFFRFKKRLQEINVKESMESRLADYFHGSMLFYICIEAASIILVAGLYLTTSAIFIVGYVLVLFLMSLHRPTPQKYVKDLRLTKKERDVILNKGEFADLETTSRAEN